MVRTLVFVGLVTAHATLATAQTSPTTRLIPYSGTVLDPSGRPTAGSETLTFELYEEQEGGAPLWQEVQSVNTDQAGRYLVYLGSVTPLPQFAFSEERARWLAVSMPGRVLPRVMLVAVPYALRAGDADTLGGQPASSFVRSRADGKLETSTGLVVSQPVIDGSGITNSLAKFDSPTTVTSATIAEVGGRVGFGLTDPTGGGVVDSVFTIRNFDNNTGFGILNHLQQRRFAINTLANGGWTIYDGGGSVWNQGITQLNGNLGIGTTAPDTKLRIIASTVDGIRATQSTAGRHAIRGVAPNGSVAITGIASDSVIDVFGQTAGVQGYTDIATGSGVLGSSSNGNGVRGTTSTGNAVEGQSFGGGLAGNFIGNVTVTGTLSKGGGSFKIDHPLDPSNKYLSHSFVESPDMMNVYNGNVTLDSDGTAWVTLPEWFEALNRDFRYQLTPIGAPGPNLYVACEVSANRFKIAGGAPGSRVSWQVTGVRHDAWANSHRIAVEEEKPESERGTYLHANELGQRLPASSSGLEFKRRPPEK